MSRNTKILLAVIGGLAVVCICIVVVAYIALQRLGSSIESSVVTDPQEASEVASAIAEFDIPAGYDIGAMHMFGIEWAILDNDQGGTIMLMQYPDNMNISQDQLEQQMQQVWQQTTNRNGLNMKVIDQQPVTIRGEQTTLTVSEGSDSQGNGFRQAIAVFPGREGQAILMMVIPSQDWDQEMIDQFIQSIR